MARAGPILVVDDDEALLYSAVEMLKEAGFEVIGCKSSIQALNILERKPLPILLLADISIPGEPHGFALARMARMRAIGIPVILWSGYDLPADSLETERVLRKPVTADQLVAVVRARLAG